MNAVILSAGHGSRLLPLTLEMPKCLVPVHGRAILLHQLEALAVAGVMHATVVVGYRHHQVEAFVAAERLPLAVDLVFNPFWSVANSIGSVWAVRDRLAAPFCLLNGDTVFDPGVLAAALYRPQCDVGLVVEPAAEPELDDMRVEVADDRVLAVAKDLPLEQATHRSLGVVTSGGGDAYRRALEAVMARNGGAGSYHHAVVAELAATVGVAAVERSPGYWREIDRPEDIAVWDEAHARGAS